MKCNVGDKVYMGGVNVIELFSPDEDVEHYWLNHIATVIKLNDEGFLELAEVELVHGTTLYSAIKKVIDQDLFVITMPLFVLRRYVTYIPLLAEGAELKERLISLWGDVPGTIEILRIDQEVPRDSTYPVYIYTKTTALGGQMGQPK